jgi:hypothetical protein
MHTGFWLESHSEDLGIDRIILKWTLRKQSWREWIGLKYLRIETGGKLL